jgi:hypothetical protein
MLTSLFSIPALIGLLAGLAALPVLIHLINMLRHRRVKWAAMDFLLQSYKKNRNWVWLKQLLLLLMRVAAMILLVLMLAQVGCRNESLSNLLGKRITHHYILLDDSYSMSDRAGTAVAFDHARQAIRLIAQRAGAEDEQRITLIRFSQALGNDSEDGSEFEVESIADLNSQAVDVDFDEVLDDRLAAIKVSQLSVGPEPALNIVEQLVEDRVDQKAFVYLVSDFRDKEWNAPTEIEQSLDSLSDAGANIQLVNCVKSQRPNLAVVDIKPTSNTRAAGVPLFVDVSVRNFGSETARKVQLKINSTLFDQGDELTGDAANVQGDTDELPTVLFQEIPPGKTETRRIQVYFSKGGKHVVEAVLPDDAVAADNRRWAVIEFPEGVPVLVIDGSEDSRGTRHLGLAFQPGKYKTGVRPDFRSLEFLRNANPESLNKYQAIYLIDLDIGGDQAIIRNLEQYVESGGGLAMFLGPRIDIASYNQNLYRDGKGLLPMPLDVITSLPEETGEEVADIVADDHPVFGTFKNVRNSFVQNVVLARYIKPPLGWTADDDPNVTVAASTRQKHPFAVERRFGKGRVLTVVTTLQPEWNNWAANPTFVITMLNMQSYLASGRHEELPRTVGHPIELQLDAQKYLAEVEFVVPDNDPAARPTIEKQATKASTESPFLTAKLGSAKKGGPDAGETDTAGVYEAWTFTTANIPDVQRWAVNVETTEGDLAVMQPSALLARLDRIDPAHVYWEDFNPDPGAEEGFSWAKALLIVLICLLVIEQLLSYIASYHPTRGGAVA